MILATFHGCMSPTSKQHQVFQLHRLPVRPRRCLVDLTMDLTEYFRYPNSDNMDYQFTAPSLAVFSLGFLVRPISVAYNLDTPNYQFMDAPVHYALILMDYQFMDALVHYTLIPTDYQFMASREMNYMKDDVNDQLSKGSNALWDHVLSYFPEPSEVILLTTEHQDLNHLTWVLLDQTTAGGSRARHRRMTFGRNLCVMAPCVLEAHIPCLVSRTWLQDVVAIIDLANQRVRFELFGVTLPLVMVNGHLGLDVL